MEVLNIDSPKQALRNVKVGKDVKILIEKTKGVKNE